MRRGHAARARLRERAAGELVLVSGRGNPDRALRGGAVRGKQAVLVTPAPLGFDRSVFSLALALRDAGAASVLVTSAADDERWAAMASAAVPLGPLTLTQRLDTREVMAPNVVAVLEGSDPALKDEHVLYSAHMDHIGTGRPDASGDSIFNGADDDASGTVAVLEVAEALASLPTGPRRSSV